MPRARKRAAEGGGDAADPDVPVPRISKRARPAPAAERTPARPARSRRTARPAAARAPAAEAAAEPAAAPRGRANARGRAAASLQAPKELRDRITRALPGSGHRIFLIAREKQGDNKERFTVLGAKADVYTVVVGPKPSCTCSDARIRRSLCKHHFFVMLRVLGLRQDDPRVWSKTLSEADALQVLRGGEELSGLAAVMADDAVRRAYLERTGQAPPVGQAAAQQAKQRPLDSDDCPVCFDALSATEAVVWCATCGNNVHAECFRLWSAQRERQGADPVCVFCRSPWGGAEAAADKPAARAPPRGRVNLMDVSQAHQEADMSSRALYGNRQRSAAAEG